jgi:superfamily I DNA and/or RNA helicase
MVRVGVGSKNKALDNISINQQVDNLIAEHKAKRLNKKAITQTLSEIKVHLRAAAVRIRKLTEQYKQLRLNSSNAAQGAAGESAQVQASIEKARVEHEYHVVAAELCKCRADYSEYRAKLKQCEILDGSTPGYKKLGFRHKLAATVLESAAIIVTTLSASAMRDVAALGKKVRFSIVVVDEAAQSIEPSVLIPLQHGAEHCVLVGDPRQLPATVLSEHAKKHLLDQSLFERLQRNGCETHLLNTQYRCHPDIAAFPSQEFYGGKLRNGDNVFQRRLECYSRPAFGPLVFMNTNFGVASQGQGGGSWSNEQEARYVTRLYQSLKALHLQLTRQGGGVPLPKWRIGIITPYQQQLSLLRKFIAGFGSETDAHVPVVLGTVDGFQGQEFDIIIMSCVRAESATDEDARALAESLEVLNGGEGRRRNKYKYKYKRPSIGFLNDQRRLNVAMTRAKYSLVMVGQAQTLTAASPLWNRLLQCVQHNGRVFDIADAKVDPLQLV